MKFPIKKSLSFEKVSKLVPGKYYSEIIKAETPEGYDENSAIELTYALSNEEDGNIVFTKTEILPFTSDRWDKLLKKIEAGGLLIDDTDELIGIKEIHTYKKVAAYNGRFYTNIVDRQFIGVKKK